MPLVPGNGVGFYPYPEITISGFIPGYVSSLAGYYTFAYLHRLYDTFLRYDSSYVFTYHVFTHHVYTFGPPLRSDVVFVFPTGFCSPLVMVLAVVFPLY